MELLQFYFSSANCISTLISSDKVSLTLLPMVRVRGHIYIFCGLDEDKISLWSFILVVALIATCTLIMW